MVVADVESAVAAEDESGGAALRASVENDRGALAAVGSSVDRDCGVTSLGGIVEIHRCPRRAFGAPSVENKRRIARCAHSGEGDIPRASSAAACAACSEGTVGGGGSLLETYSTSNGLGSVAVKGNDRMIGGGVIPKAQKATTIRLYYGIGRRRVTKEVDQGKITDRNGGI